MLEADVFYPRLPLGARQLLRVALAVATTALWKTPSRTFLYLFYSLTFTIALLLSAFFWERRLVNFLDGNSLQQQQFKEQGETILVYITGKNGARRIPDEVVFLL